MCDGVLLARPQVDALFVGLLLLVNRERYMPLLSRGAWISDVRGALYDLRQSRSTANGRSAYQVQRRVFLENAAAAGIPRATAVQILDDAAGDELEKLDTAKNRLPSVSDALHDGVFDGTRFEALAPLIWWPWKRLSDSAHLSVNLVLTRAFLRGDDVSCGEGIARSVVIRGIHRNSILISLVSMLTLATAITVQEYADDDKLFRRCADAWDRIANGDPTARAVWDGWARAALRVLPARRPRGAGPR